MGKLSSLLYGLAIGAGLMYFLDPQQGNRRKAMIRNRAYRLRNQGDEALEVAVNDLRNRVRGLLAEGMAMVSNEAIPDEVLRERVRARLGMLTRHPGAIQVDVQDGQVLLDGDVLEDEMGIVTRGLSRVRGVAGVENRLRAHATAGNIQQLQGEGWIQQPGQWSPSTRLLATAGSGYLLLYSMLRGGFIGFIAKVGGLALGVRALTNMNPRQLAGSGMDQGMLRVRKSIQINAPVEEVYGLWSNFENFSQFMHNVVSIEMMGDRSHWVVKGPAGTQVEFDAITRAMVPNEMVSWETTPESQVKHSGQVRFREMDGSTQVNVTMAYTPPAGVVGHAVASLFGKDPKTEMDADLARMKSLLEKGRTSTGGRKVTREEVVAGIAGGDTHSDTRGEPQAQNARKQEGGKQGKKNRQNQGANDSERSQQSAGVPVTGSEASTGEFEAIDYGGSEMTTETRIGHRSSTAGSENSGMDMDEGSLGVSADDVSENIRRDMGGGEENSPKGSGQV